MNKLAYLGIDISKGYADFFFVGSDKVPIEPPFRLYDVSDGHSRLKELFSKWLSCYHLSHIYCGVESTGGYENNWVDLLLRLSGLHPLKVARLNAKGVKSLSDAALTRTITDSVSAESIAMYLIDFQSKIHWIENNDTSKRYQDARRHNSLIRMLKKQRIQLSNQLEKLMYQELSALMCYCRHGVPNWMLSLLLKYPKQKSILKAGAKTLCKINGVTSDKAKAMLQKLKDSASNTSDHTGHIMVSTIKQILILDKAIKDEKTKLMKAFQKEPTAAMLMSIPGIGLQSAVEILIEIENVTRFEDAKKLSAYFGLHPVFKQSGDGKWSNHMSKKGRSEIRAVLFMSGLTAVRYSALFKGIYARARAKGKNHFNAMGIVMHKLLRVIFGVLKNNKPFDADADSANQARAKEKQREKEEEVKEEKKQYKAKLERYNEAELSESPISKRHAKKRTKRKVES